MQKCMLNKVYMGWRLKNDVPRHGIFLNARTPSKFLQAYISVFHTVLEKAHLTIFSFLSIFKV